MNNYIDDKLALKDIKKVLESFELPCYSGHDEFCDDIEEMSLSEIKQTLFDLYEGIYKIAKIVMGVKPWKDTW